MSLLSNGIYQVRAIKLPAGIWSEGEQVGLPRTALVRWRSDYSDKFYQVYVNGKFAGAGFSVSQRQMIVALPLSVKTAVRIEVFAVEAQEVNVDFSDELDCSAGSGRVKIVLLRSQGIPIDSTADIYFDNGSGEIDYANPVNKRPIRIWPSRYYKCGFGMSRFAVSDFGYDGSAAVGLGMGSFGNERFSFDADTIEWVSKPLSAGVYKFAVKIRDGKGNQSGASETGEIAVIPAAQPAEKVSIGSFDKVVNQLVLNVI